MLNSYFQQSAKLAGRGWLWAGLCVGGLLSSPAQAQAPTWALATAGSVASATSASTISAVATDASGNLFVVGTFFGQVSFGSTTLASAGYEDLFLAKYAPATNTWLWAVRAGGTGSDMGMGVAVSGSNVYLTGSITNNTANANNVVLGGTPIGNTVVQNGASAASSDDLLVAKYIDNGTGVTAIWSQVAGSAYPAERGAGIAVQGSNVYVVGTLFAGQTATTGGVFGGAGTTPGTVIQNGASSLNASTDIVVAKYVDNGLSGSLGWTQVAGGIGLDYGQAIAVSGTNVYVTGAISNNLSNANAITFGGTGTTAGTAPQYGASPTTSQDMVLAKYTDNGTSATVGWTQVAGGTGADVGYALAVQGSDVYVTGSLYNDAANGSTVVFGGTGTTLGTSAQYGTGTASLDLYVAKYTDQGTSAALRWTQVGGGIDSDMGYGLAIGNAGRDVYVAGRITNTAANADGVVFGGTGTTPGTLLVPGASPVLSTDIAIAKYTDNGSSAVLNWTQVAGGPGVDTGTNLALVGTRLYTVGAVGPPATFGPLTINGLTNIQVSFVAALDLSSALATTPVAAGQGLQLFPNPAPGAATLSGAAPGATVHVFDALGRRVATTTADATGAATLPAGLAPGLYLVRAGTSTVRWVVE